MSTIIALIHSRFMKGAESAAAWLEGNSYESLFLALPIDLEKFLNSYTDGELSGEDLWRSYRYLTGVQLPFINALRYSIDPIITVLPKLRHKMPEPEIHCYQDTEGCIEATKLTERVVLLESRGRMGGRIDVGAWRALLHYELDFEIFESQRSLENIAENAVSYSRNVVLSQGMGKSFRSYMEARGFNVEAIYLKHYWRSPLEVLRVMARTRGIDNLSDEVIANCIQDQLRYLEYILHSKNLDAAHEKWTMEVQPNLQKLRHSRA
jgi:hypothetical protein